MKTLAVTLEGPTRMDVALAATLDISRAKAQKLILDGVILVDGVVANRHQKITERSVVEMDDAKVNAEPAAPMAPPALDILYEDTDVIVVNKPAGLLVHPTPISTEPTLVDALKAHVPAIETVGDDKVRAGIVHRLDKEASGVLIAAKTNAAFAHLKSQFANRKTEKHYTVLVMGSVNDDSGTITFPIGRSKTKARMAARPMSQDGKDAITHFDVVERFTSTTLLDVRIETGRTHQIRAHMFALGNPVAGDKLYVKKGLKQLALGRLFLHARSLTIELPSGETQTFEAPLPQVLADLQATFMKTERHQLAGIGGT